MHSQESSPPASEQPGLDLYEQYATSIFAYIRLHIASLEDAEDILLEVFTTALEQGNLSWLERRQKLAWLRSVAHHKVVDHYRRSAHGSLLSLEQIIENIIGPETLTPEQALLRREEIEELHRAIRELPQLQQQLLQLRVADCLRFAEIAILLNKREATLRKMYSRTLAHLRTTCQKREKGQHHDQ
ncbi:MAG TPA: sigma-70 family RNA polymerase sigma factor [Ktedonobacteraceae bacterium]|jgi:RNA polymerase sigma-70 factor (ECF subfamily)|nr:sigma-70 family RNA polymerase sigma factor [Ktedonobacteraceae bacterium]